MLVKVVQTTDKDLHWNVLRVCYAAPIGGEPWLIGIVPKMAKHSPEIEGTTESHVVDVQ